jgi:hypothetical protein
VGYLSQQFSAHGYRLPAIVRKLATSAAFYKVDSPSVGQTAKLGTPARAADIAITTQERTGS